MHACSVVVCDGMCLSLCLQTVTHALACVIVECKNASNCPSSHWKTLDVQNSLKMSSLPRHLILLYLLSPPSFPKRSAICTWPVSGPIVHSPKPSGQPSVTRRWKNWATHFTTVPCVAPTLSHGNKGWFARPIFRPCRHGAEMWGRNLSKFCLIEGYFANSRISLATLSSNLFGWQWMARNGKT